MVVSVSCISEMDRSKVLSERLCSGLALKHEEKHKAMRINLNNPICYNPPQILTF